MHKFEYSIELKNGYKPVMETEMETEINIVIEAKCRVDADRAIKALLRPDNVNECIGICID